MSRGEDTRGKPVAMTTAAGLPLHRQLFLVLHDEIERGAIPAGDPLPTEHELCEQFGVSRITVRRALSDLADQGYITRRQGVGSFVREHDLELRQAPTRSYMDELQQTQFETDADVVEFDLREAPRVISDKVGFTGEVLHTLRVRRDRRTGEPLLLTEAWLPAGLAETITAEKLARTALYLLLGEAGVILERVQHEISAEIAGPRSAQLLDIAIGAAIIRVNRLAFAGGDRPHHYLSIVLSPSRSRILLNHSAEELLIGDTMAMLHDVRPST
jgi:GntR family transcriptional regulator